MTRRTSSLLEAHEDVDLAVRETLTRIKGGGAANNFTCAALAFDTTVTKMIGPIDVSTMDEFSESFDPLPNHGGGTDIGLALEEAERIANDWLAQNTKPGGVVVDAVIVLLSDGGHNCGAAVKPIADRIKSGNGGRVKIAAALLAEVGQPDAAGEALLREIVSEPRLYSTVYTGDQLRNFFTATLTRVSGVNLRR
jgi:hypothetical protein